MKQQLVTSASRIFKDRYLASLLLGFILFCIGVIVYLLLLIHPTELQIVVHYTTFGSTNFYRDKWYYLLAFVAFIILVAVTHAVLAYRLLDAKGRQFAAAFLWLGIIIVVMTATMSYQIMKVASLS